jgi:hypothetical protein
MIFDNERNNYTLYGTLFGLAFPLGAISFEIIMRGMDFSLAAIIYLHTEVLLLWMIDSAPLVLGLFARFAGAKQDMVIENLNNMQKTIDERTRHLQQNRDEAEKASLEKSLLNELSQITTTTQNSRELAQSALSYLVQTSGSQVGILYKVGEESLTRLASFAFREDKHHKEEMPFGESLLGQCAVEKQVMQINSLPKDYLSVESSLGGAQSSHVILLPLIFEENLLAIIELGAFESFGSNQVALLKKCADVIAISLNATLNREQLSNLVKQLKT